MVVKIESVEDFDALWDCEEVGGCGHAFSLESIKKITEEHGWDLLRDYLIDLEEEGYTVYYHCKQREGRDEKILCFVFTEMPKDECIVQEKLVLALLENLEHGIYVVPEEGVEGLCISIPGNPVSCPLF